MKLSRRTSYTFLSIALLGLAWAAFCRIPTRPVLNSPPPRPGIVMLGDSLTSGVGARPGNALPTQLSTLLGLPVANQGASGDTTAGALRRLDQALASKPGTVIVFLGGNDWLQNIHPETTESDLTRIIQRCQGKGCMVVLVGLNGGPGVGYSSMFRRLAGDNGCLLIPDALKGILFNPSLKYDSIHPNDEGYALIARRIADRLKPFLATPASGR